MYFQFQMPLIIVFERFRQKAKRVSYQCMYRSSIPGRIQLIPNRDSIHIMRKLHKFKRYKIWYINFHFISDCMTGSKCRESAKGPNWRNNIHLKVHTYWSMTRDNIHEILTNDSRKLSYKEFGKNQVMLTIQKPCSQSMHKIENTSNKTPNTVKLSNYTIFYSWHEEGNHYIHSFLYL